MVDHALRGRTRYPGLVDSKVIPYFDPLTLGNLKLWLDFSDISTMYTDNGITNVASDADKIYRINDKSGNGFNAVQTTENARPLYKTAVQNERSAALFDGSNDYFSLPNMGFVGDASISIFVVHKTIDGVRVYFGFGAGITNNACVIRSNTTTSYIWYWWDNDLTATVSSFYGSFVQVCALYDHINSMRYIYQNGILGNLQAPSNASWANSNYTVGRRLDSAKEFMNGYISEILVYSSALSNTDRGKVESYLQTKWDL